MTSVSQPTSVQETVAAQGWQPPSLWGRVKKQGAKAGKRAGLVAEKAKLRGEMNVMDNRIQERKQAFGVELYDALALQSEADPTFIIDHPSLDNIRGEFVTCFKDNKGLGQTLAIHQQQLSLVEKERELAFSTNSNSSEESAAPGLRLKNGCRAANFARKSVGAKNKIKVLEDQLLQNKNNFGLEIYTKLVRLENREQWLPEDPDIRELYDQARREVTVLIEAKQQMVYQVSKLNTTTVT